MPDLRLSIISIIAALAALGLVFELLRRRRLREKYAAIWVVIAVGTVVVAVFPQILQRVADLVGIRTPSNLLFFGSLIVLFAVSLQLSREVGLLEEQSRRLAEEVGTLTMRVDALEKAAGRLTSTTRNTAFANGVSPGRRRCGPARGTAAPSTRGRRIPPWISAAAPRRCARWRHSHA